MSSRPFTIVIAAALQALIGLAAALGGLYSLYSAVTGQVNDVMSAIPLAAAGLGVGALLVFVARGLWRLDDWARTPVFLTQLFLAVTAYYMFTGEQYAAAVLLGAVAVAAGAAVLSPPTTAALFPAVQEPRKKR
ncbi:hypothetical protein [Nocardiopsis xinjiangensis]|uniref:hypothetical protein n=1 Tax=Nocardiopsis xinjiangensis TaxID=124285 RepID=UPI00034926F9|nr:hypothetical protein [Nocardiopsis xinjiangensis]